MMQNKGACRILTSLYVRTHPRCLLTSNASSQITATRSFSTRATEQCTIESDSADSQARWLQCSAMRDCALRFSSTDTYARMYRRCPPSRPESIRHFVESFDVVLCKYFDWQKYRFLSTRQADAEPTDCTRSLRRRRRHEQDCFHLHDSLVKSVNIALESLEVIALDVEKSLGERTEAYLSKGRGLLLDFLDAIEDSRIPSNRGSDETQLLLDLVDCRNELCAGDYSIQYANQEGAIRETQVEPKPSVPQEGVWSPELSKNEIARRYLNNEIARFRACKQTIKGYGLRHRHGNKWKVRVDQMDLSARERILNGIDKKK